MAELVEDDDNDSYVPESLRGVFADADKKLEQDLTFLLDGADDEPRVADPSLEEEMSPPLEAPPSTNPAALLTHGAAKDLAMEGVTPNSLDDDDDAEEGGQNTAAKRNTFSAVVNLQSQLDDVAGEVDEDVDNSRMMPAVTPSSASSQSASASPPPSSSSNNSNSKASKSSGRRGGGNNNSAQKLKDRIRGNSRKVAPVPPETKDTRTPKKKMSGGVGTSSSTSTSSSSGGGASKGKLVVELQSGALQLDTPTRTARPGDQEQSSATPGSMQKQQQQHDDVPTPNNTTATPIKPTTTPSLLQGTPTSQLQLQNPQVVENRTGEDPSPQRPKEISFLPSERPTAASPLMTSPSLAHRNNNRRTTRDTPSAGSTSSPPPILTSSSLLRGTVASQGKLDRHRTAATAGVTSPHPPSTTGPSPAPTSGPWQGRKELTSPDTKLPSRLLQGTSASRARFSKSGNDTRPKPTAASALATSKPVPLRLLQPTETVEVHLAESPVKGIAVSKAKKEQLEKEREETKARVQARLELQQQKEKERKQALQLKMRKRQELQKKMRDKTQASLARAKTKREQLETKEQERVDKLRKEIEEKEERLRQRLAEREKENQRPSTTKKTSKSSTVATKPAASRKFKPTIPIAPTFLTDQRLKAHDINNDTKTRAEDPIPMASSDAFLRQGLRGETAPTPRHIAAQRQQLTIPKGPRLSTSKRRERKDAIMAVKPKKQKNIWENELRSVSSPLASDRSTASRLTIPKTPNFHEIHHRPRPKSTAEKETEEMEYFKTHPFKAQPVKMNEVGSVSSKATKPRPARQLTTPSPFQFRTDQRLSSARRRVEDTPKGEDDDESARVQLFKARPAPKFKPNKTPLTGKRPTANRSVTTPEPFHFHSVGHRYHKTPQSEAAEGKKEPLFKARPMPSFTRPTGLTLERRMVRTSEYFQEVPAERYAWSDAPDRASEGGGDEAKPSQFHARPMPSFETVAIPVKERNPERTRSSPPHLVQEEPEAEPAPFRARKLPKSLVKPSIPVKQRDPAKLRSPEEVRASSPEDTKKPVSVSPIDTTHGFQARRAPKRSPPSIPVRPKNPTKLRSPTSITKDRRPDTSSQPTKEVVPGFKARAMPRSHHKGGVCTTTPTLTVPNWGSPQKEASPKRETTVKERLRQRLKGRQSNFAAPSNGTSSKFASSNVRTRLQRVAPVGSPEPVAGIPSAIHVSPAVDAEIDEDAVDEFHDAYDLTRMAEKAAREVMQTATPTDDEKRRQVEAAAHEWSLSSTPRAGTGAGPLSTEELEKAKAREAEAMKMALDLQRAADDELSYHESSGTNSREYQMGYEEGEFMFESS